MLTAALVAVTAAATAAISPVPAYAAQRSLKWVAMGDSYTAGLIKAAGQEYENPRDGCARTDHSYPQVVGRRLGSMVNLRNVSCSGATIANIHRERQKPVGRHIPPISIDPDYPFDEVPVQLKAVRRDTNLVTVGIGGNSLGFSEILKKCIALGLAAKGKGTPCKHHYRTALADRLNSVRRQYAGMLRAIHRKAPSARIITVGYPHVIPEDATTCQYASPTDFATITHGDLDWLRAKALEPLNGVIKKSTRAHRATYVDLYASSRGHSVCEKAGGNNWVDGLFDTSGSPALVHPNAKGHANAAARVSGAILGRKPPAAAGVTTGR